MTFSFDTILVGDCVKISKSSIKLQKEVALLIGPNGCGKTSLLFAMAGIKRKHINIVNGHWDYAPRQIGLLNQNYDETIFPWLSIEGNKKFYGSTRDSTEALFVDFSIKTHDKVNKLSGGMRQRLAIGKESAFTDGLLLFDEPFSAQAKKRDILSVFEALNTSVLIVTHDQEIISISKNIYVFKQIESASVPEYVIDQIK